MMMIMVICPTPFSTRYSTQAQLRMLSPRTSSYEESFKHNDDGSRKEEDDAGQVIHTGSSSS